MKLTSSASNSYTPGNYDTSTVLDDRLAALDQGQALYWETLVTLGLFILAIVVLM
jgi:hypothetical protein